MEVEEKGRKERGERINREERKRFLIIPQCIINT